MTLPTVCAGTNTRGFLYEQTAFQLSSQVEQHHLRASFQSFLHQRTQSENTLVLRIPVVLFHLHAIHHLAQLQIALRAHVLQFLVLVLARDPGPTGTQLLPVIVKRRRAVRSFEQCSGFRGKRMYPVNSPDVPYTDLFSVFHEQVVIFP